MIVRVATEEDWPSLQSLAIWLDFEHREQIGAEPVLDQVTNGMRHAFWTGQDFVVAEAGRALIGFCAWVNIPGMPDGELMGLGTYVRPTHRRSGASQRMREMMEDIARRRGARGVTGVVVPGNHPGLESVLKLGFRVTGWLVKKEFRDEGQEVRQGNERIEGREGDGPEDLRVVA